MATKRGKLSRIETFYIDGNRDKTADQLATDLNRGLKVIQKYLDENPVDSGQSLAGENIVTEKGTTIMTEAASMAADASKSPRRLPASHERCTSKIKK